MPEKRFSNTKKFGETALELLGTTKADVNARKFKSKTISVENKIDESIDFKKMQPIRRIELNQKGPCIRHLKNFSENSWM